MLWALLVQETRTSHPETLGVLPHLLLPPGFLFQGSGPCRARGSLSSSCRERTSVCARFCSGVHVCACMHVCSGRHTCVHAGRAQPVSPSFLEASLSQGSPLAERKGSEMAFHPSGGFIRLTHCRKGPLGLPGNQTSRCIHLPYFYPAGQINTASKTPMQCHFTCSCKFRLSHSPSLCHSHTLPGLPASGLPSLPRCFASHPRGPQLSPAWWQRPAEQPAWPGCRAGAEPQLGCGEDGNAAELPRDPAAKAHK